MYKDERFFDSSGTPYPMAHAFYQKQAKIAGYFVDGFTKTPSGNMIIEVNGCYWVRVQKIFHDLTRWGQILVNLS